MRKVLLLPGYSPYNKEAQDQLFFFLQEKGFEVKKIEWEHWEEGKSFSYPKERRKILSAVADWKEFSVVAKSVGTRILADMMRKGQLSPQKVLLMGIPSLALEYKEAFSSFPPQNLLVIQNTKDPLVPFEMVREFFQEINPEFQVLEKPAKDHNYPYFEEIFEFLKT